MWQEKTTAAIGNARRDEGIVIYPLPFRPEHLSEGKQCVEHTVARKDQSAKPLASRLGTGRSY